MLYKLPEGSKRADSKNHSGTWWKKSVGSGTWNWAKRSYIPIYRTHDWRILVDSCQSDWPSSTAPFLAKTYTEVQQAPKSPKSGWTEWNLKNMREESSSYHPGETFRHPFEALHNPPSLLTQQAQVHCILLLLSLRHLIFQFARLGLQGGQGNTKEWWFHTSKSLLLCYCFIWILYVYYCSIYI